MAAAVSSHALFSMIKQGSKAGWGELSAAEMESRISQLQDMGFSHSAAHSSLEVCEWDVNRALDSLLMHKVPASGHDAFKLRSSISSASTSASDSPPLSPQDMARPKSQESAAPKKTKVPLLWTSIEATPDTPSRHDASQRPVHTAATTLTAEKQLATPVSYINSPGVSVAPKRHLAKIQHSWTCEEELAETQLSVEADSFVYVWTESKTVAGWIYAESLICSSRAGWLPASMLQQLPPTQRWMRVSKPCRAIYPTQLSVELGNILLVDLSKPPVGDGWIYAEQLSSATGSLSAQSSAGWVPIQCITWTTAV